MIDMISLDVGGQSLRVALRAGRSDGPPLLLINGLGASLELLEPVVAALDGIATIRIDLPGTGGSAAPAVPYRPSGLATLLMRALDRLGYGTVDVLGLSLGGVVAQQLAWQYAERVRRLVLVSTATGAVMIPGSPFAFFAMLTPRRFTDPGYMANVAPYLYGGQLRTKPEVAARLHRILKPGGVRGYYWQLLGLAGWTSIHFLPRLRQPTLVLSGADDPIVPPVNARLMSWLIPDARLHIFDDGHLGLITAAGVVAPIVRDFLVQRTEEP
jgi:poly(3-hydroxyalkanoate) depolymerase